MRQKGIKVNANLQTTVPNIYASGDVIDKKIPKLTPTATFESNYIADHILDHGTAAIEYPVKGMFVDIITLIINKKMTKEELNQMIFAFPTESYGLISMVTGILK